MVIGVRQSEPGRVVASSKYKAEFDELQGWPTKADS